MLSCPSCSANNPATNKFCGACGQQLKLVCATCGAESQLDKKFCGNCGAALDEAVHQSGDAPHDADPRPTGPERRHITALSLDLAGSTELSTRLDPEEYREVVRAYQGCVHRAMIDEGGLVTDTSGDGMMCVFGFPTASEDDAERAVRAGLAALCEITRLDLPGGLRLHARAGAATGLVVASADVGPDGTPNEAFGEALNLAARLQSIAPKDGILICPSTRRLCRDAFDYRERSPTKLKGFAHPLGSYEALPRVAGQRNWGELAPLVGRDEELETLLRRWRDARDGRGRVVVLGGEPGIGKSRIVQGLLRALVDEAPTILRYFCSPRHQNSALRPLLDQFAVAAGFGSDDAPAQRFARIQTLFAASPDPLAATLIGDAMGLPHGKDKALAELAPQDRKARTFESVLGEFERLSRNRPTLMVFEDAHWIDPTSLDLLAAAVERVRSLNAMIIITGRPEFTPPWPDHAHVSTLSLSRLDETEGEELVARSAGGVSLPREVSQRILERADGVPLFIEELTKTVVESGFLERSEEGFTLASALPDLPIPTTIHASLLARLERLAPVRDVAQIGAAIGRQFSRALIGRLTSLPEGRLDTALTELIDAGILFARGAGQDARYIFKHALLRDAAYSSVLRSRRAGLHAAIADALLEEYPQIAETEPEILALHLSEAGRCEDAARHHLSAARAAARRSAMIEAVAQLRDGLLQVGKMKTGEQRNRLELELRYTLGPCLIATKGPASADCIENNSAARGLCEALGNPEEVLQVMFWIVTAGVIRGELEDAAEAVATLGELAAARKARAAYVNALRGASMIALFRGRLEEAKDFAVQTLETLAKCTPKERADAASAGQDAEAATLSLMSWTVWALGDADTALEHSNAALTRAETVDHPHTKAYAFYYDAVLRALNEDLVAARTSAEACRTLSETHGFRHWIGLAEAVRAICDAQLGVDDALTQLEFANGALAAYRRSGYQLGVTALYLLEARAHLALASRDGAARTASMGLEFTSSRSEKLFEAELLRLAAAAEAPGSPRAQTLLAKARAKARAQGAAMFEAAAVRDLAALGQAVDV